MNFADIRNHLYDRAEKYWWASLLLGLGVQVVAATSTVIQNASFTVIAGAILFCVPIIARWSQEKSKDDTLKALKCRLAILYSDALGGNIPSHIAREIKSWAEEKSLSRAPFKRPYYDSKLPHGPNRLADIVSESAFWTYNLAGNMRVAMALYAGIYLVSALTVLQVLFRLDLGAGVLIDTAKLVIVLISLVFTSEAVLLITEYNELYVEAKNTYAVTGQIALTNGLDIAETMQVTEGYNILLASSPPIPGRLYKIRQPSLNKAYKKALKNE